MTQSGPTRRGFIAAAGAVAGLGGARWCSADSGQFVFDKRPYYAFAQTNREAPTGLFVFLHEMMPNIRAKTPFVPSAKHAFGFWKKTNLFGKDTVLACPQGQIEQPSKEQRGRLLRKSWCMDVDRTYLASFIAHLVDRHRIDPKLIFIGGFGQDARYALELASYHNDTRYEGVLICSPWTVSVDNVPSKVVRMPRYFLEYSTNNEMVNVEGLRRFAKKWTDEGFSVTVAEDSIGYAMGQKTVDLYKQMRHAPPTEPADGPPATR